MMNTLYDDDNPYAPPPDEDVPRPWEAAPLNGFVLDVRPPRLFSWSALWIWLPRVLMRMFLVICLPLFIPAALFVLGIVLARFFIFVNPALDIIVLALFCVIVPIYCYLAWKLTPYWYVMGDDQVWQIAESLQLDETEPSICRFRGEMAMTPRIRPSIDTADDLGVIRLFSTGLRFDGDCTTLFIPYTLIDSAIQLQAILPILRVNFRDKAAEKYHSVAFGIRDAKTYRENRQLRDALYDELRHRMLGIADRRQPDER